MSITLWIVQGLLALLFLGLGLMKLTLPLDDPAMTMGLPVLFIRFIGLAEVLGAVGLILPALLKVRTGLVSLAAAGLALVTAGATVFHLANADGFAVAAFPLVVTLLSGFVAYGRWQLAPHGQPASKHVEARI
ncbi:MAG TPA: DoxX family protein [Chloroflexota bacterium]|nr:DoxX family protein [Chloroflexota bacterium]